MPQHVQSIDIRKVEIREDDVWMLLADQCDSLLTGICPQAGESLADKKAHAGLDEVEFVIDYEDVLSHTLLPPRLRVPLTR